MLSFGRHALAKLWITGDLRALILCHATILVVAIVESMYTLCYPCALSRDVYSEICATPLTTLLVVQSAKVVIVSCTLSWGIFKSVWAPEILSWSVYKSKSRSILPISEETENCAVVSRNWAAAASRDVFEDTVKVGAVTSENLLLAACRIIMLIFNTCIFL